MTITRINQFEARQGQEEELFKFLQSVIVIIEQCAGCRSCQLLRSVDNPACLAIIEAWDSIEAHQNAAKAIPPEKMQQARELFGKPPSGMYYQAFQTLRFPDAR
jgi:quinol monooxygenase YgiN